MVALYHLENQLHAIGGRWTMSLQSSSDTADAFGREAATCSSYRY
jgi:hypothetical protein